MVRSRSASHTIAGYHYQFDKSLIEILKAGDTEMVTLEGIEDIDLSAESIQCKYHASQKYFPSKIKAPLLEFLTHFSQNSERITYTLYTHFQEGSAPPSFTLTEAKTILGTSLDPLGLSDSDLESFLQNQLRCIAARNIDEQRKEVLSAIGSALDCTPLEAEDYFYGNALHEVIRLSRQPTISSRQINRQHFVSKINRKRRLFSHWLRQLQGEQDYQRYVRAALRSRQALLPTKHKYFFIHESLIKKSTVQGVITLCGFLVNRFFRLNYALRDAVPPTVILDCEDAVVLEVKRGLLNQRIMMNDGFEHLGFQPWIFDLAPVINRTVTQNGRPTDKIGAASYVIRLIGRKAYDANNENLDHPHVCIVTGPDLNGWDPLAGEIIHLDGVDTTYSLISILE